MSKLDRAHELIDQLVTDAREATVRDILIDLRDSLTSGPTAEDEDTWVSGFKAAIETITANY